MIDLHSHILPGIDDGAPDLATSLDMARAWVADGVSVLACTPHILPGLYHNTGPQIRAAVENLQRELDDRGIPLFLVTGADNHVVPEFVQGLQSGHLLSLYDTRYVLVEPPHHIAPPRMEDLFFSIMAAGYAPILTHPERLTWIKSHYGVVRDLARRGVWMQITAGSLTGAFGRSALYWSERMLDEGLVHILATDAHDMRSRPPVLGEGWAAAARRAGAAEAERLVYTRPLAVLENRPPSSVPMPAPVSAPMPAPMPASASMSTSMPASVHSGSEVTYAIHNGREASRKRRGRAEGGVLAGVRGVSERLQRFFG